MLRRLAQTAIGVIAGAGLAIFYAEATAKPQLQPVDAIAQPQASLCPSPLRGQQFAKTELYFGSLTPTGTEVTAAEFAHFLEREVSPRFPDGLTLLNGFGEFKGANGKTIQETSRLVIVFYPLTTDSNQKIEQIRQAYKAGFKQESVLRVDGKLCVSF
ncbi:MAG: DUF3574 domain-containing protein [Aphanocapsa sp. GSE-SYN-MK-11-07L]|nr:DUF3574 domain-containing protein [Aphanocapsa sp. GSE-SYN-MK-11-07L]